MSQTDFQNKIQNRHKTDVISESATVTKPEYKEEREKKVYAELISHNHPPKIWLEVICSTERIAFPLFSLLLQIFNHKGNIEELKL